MRTSFAVFALALAACDELPPQDPADLPDWSDGFENVVTDTGDTTTGYTEPTSPIPPDTEFNLSIGENVNWPAMMRRWDPVTGEVFADEPCALDLSNVTPGQPIVEHCILEENEGDVRLMGAQVNLHVPVDFCDYAFADYYIYQEWESGPGPTALGCTIEADGTIVDDNSGTDDCQPVCQYNYSPGPNCCTGEYTLTVRSVDSEGVVTATVTNGEWGGDYHLGDCFDGGGYVADPGGLTDDGYPTSPYFFLDRDAADLPFAFGPLVDRERFSDGYGTTVAIANYVDLADHGGQLPESMRAAGAHSTYDFICTDNALEKLGILYLTIREWNTEAEFALDGDPDAREGEQELLDPFQEYNDIWDWRNLDSSYRNNFLNGAD